MLNLIKVDIENCINNMRFKVSFFILFAISIINYIFTLLNSINEASNVIHITRYQGIILGTGGGGRSVWGFFILIMPLLVVSIFSDSFYLEKKSGSYISIFQRTGKTKYVLSKLIVCGIISFFSVLFVILINEVLSYITFNGVGSYLAGYPSYESIYMNSISLLGSFGDEHIMLGKFIIILINSIYAAIISMFAFSISLVFDVKNYVIIVGVFILDYMIDLLMPSMLFEKFSMFLMRQGGGESFIYFLITIVLWSLIIGIFTTIGLKKDLF
ncbi:hypothetical protein FHH43_14995 [Clostridium perfringens]|nr:hypothetical protein [Clostridium perfringens]